MRTPNKNTFFHWKSKWTALYRLKEILRYRLLRRDAHIKRLEERIAKLELITEAQKVKEHRYPAQMMALAVFIVVYGGSLRLAAQVVGFYAQLMGWEYAVPSHVTVRNWAMRCGLYQLGKAGEAKKKMTLIIDESVQLGKEKLLLLLGICKSMHQTQVGALCHEDVQVLGMSVQPSWKGEQIAAFVKDRLGTLGIRADQVISDCGSNLLKAYGLLNLQHIADCSHHMMNGVKKIFKDDTELSQLCAHIGRLRQQLSMTDFAYLLPPSLRDKDRFCRVFQLNDWLGRINEFQLQDEEGVTKYLTFLKGTEALQLRLRQVEALVEIVGTVLRHCGLSQAAQQLIQQRVQDYLATQPTVTSQATDFMKHVANYFDKHQGLIQDGKRWLCCSEVIESMFGKYKNKGGMKMITADVLFIPLYGVPITVDFVKTAVESTPIKSLSEWEANQVCMSRYGMLRALKNQQIARAA